MRCEFKYCIYNRGFNCISDGVEINYMGMCDRHIIVSLDKDFLEREKERQLTELEKRWSELDKKTKPE